MRTKRSLQLAVAMLILVAFAAGTSVADTPNVMNYQGRLTDDVGDPLTGSFDLTFRLYNVSVGGAALWTETHLNVSVTGGLFNVLLGESTTLSHDEFSDVPRFLGVTVEADPEMSPRTELATVGYAFRTATVDGAFGGTINGDLVLQSTAAVNALEIAQGGLGRGLRIGMNNPGNSEAALAIAMQSGGPAIQLVLDGGGPAIDVINGFGDASVNLPSGAISSFEILDESVTQNDLADNSVSSTELANNAVRTAEILNGTILSEDIASNEINSDRLENEPGAAQNIVTASFALTNSVASYVSRSINCPTSGYALVMASATATIIHNNGQNNTILFGVSETGTALDGDQNKLWSISSAVPSGTQQNIISAQKVFPAVAGANSYHLAAMDASGNSGKTISDMTLTIIFIPSVYGTLSQ